jgi:hypothetical protein
MNWLETGLKWFKIAKDFIDKDKKEAGDPQSGGFLSKQAQNRFGMPSSPKAAGFTLLQKGIGRSTQGLTDAERILEPIHRLQSNGYDALSNALIQKAIKDGNMITSRDLMPETSAHSDSQNISLGKTTL